MIAFKRLALVGCLLGIGCDSRSTTVGVGAPSTDTGTVTPIDVVAPPPEDVTPPPPPPEDVPPPPPDDTKLNIKSVDPAVGQSKGGDVVTVVGSGFIQGRTQVFFGASLAIDIFVLDAGRLTCTTPPGSPGLVDVKVADTEAKTEKTLAFGFRYQNPVLIVSVDPPQGLVTGGEPVTLGGTGFSQGSTVVLIGGRAAINVQVVDDGTVQLTTPVGDGPGPVDIHLSNDTGAALLKGGFLYVEKPAIVSLTPAVGPVEGGNEVTIEGHGFVDPTSVTFGATPATKATVLDPDHVLAVVPPGALGPVTVGIDNLLGTASLGNGYYYVDAVPPAGVKVVTVQPATGSVDGGETVKVTAFGLTSVADTLVTFGGQAAVISSVDTAKSSAVVLTPPHAAGLVDVAVKTSNGEDTLAGAFGYLKAFKVLTVNPLSGPTEGGTAVSIYGEGFEPGADVHVGALPCAKVKVVNAKTIECTTPAGSPGGADVRVTQGEAVAMLPNGYFYESGGAELFVVDPDTGSQAGGTFVRLLGAGFKAPVTVRFGGAKASHVTLVSSTLITCKTPPGEIGPSDVTVESDSGTTTLPQSYVYFNPVALYGGTWGPEVEGSVNVTVLDASNGNAIADAFVMLYVNPDTPYQGFTNSQGQVTFSGPELLGQQMVSASKECYASESVIAFDATNITMYLSSNGDPKCASPGPPPPPPPGATLSGKVVGLGKYVVAPPGDCKLKNPATLPNGLCTPCTVDTDCPVGGQACTEIGDTGKFCTVPCATDADCVSGFSCLKAGKAGAPQCIPTPGKKQARCFFTLPSMFSQSVDWETIPGRIAKADGSYQIPAYLGELAVVCLGGIVSWDLSWDGKELFTAYAFGVKRHINVAPGDNPDQDVTLNHPLTRTVKVRLDNAPFDPINGPEFNGALLYWDFGSDGVFAYNDFQDVIYGGDAEGVMKIEHQPSNWTGDVYDATWSILGIALTFTDDPQVQLPASYTLLTNLKTLDSDTAFALEAGQWHAVESGVTRTVNALHGFADNDIWGVGDAGAILQWNGAGWALQASPTDQALYGVWGSSHEDVWAAGAQGTLAHFNGVTWSPVALPSATGAELRGLWGSSKDDVWLVGGGWTGAWHFDGTAWSKANMPGGDLRDVHGVAKDAVWTVGRYGAIRFFDGANWNVQNPGNFNDMYSVHAISKTEVYAVGAEGLILAWDGALWTTMPSPTQRTLRAVWAEGTKDVYAVGDGGVLLHYDGVEWTDQTLPGKAAQNSLLAMWGNGETGKAFAMGTSEVLMGPMLQVPEQQNPEDGGTMKDYHIGFNVKPGPAAHFHYLSVAVPGLLGDTPVWNITTKGDVFEFDLPDFANIEGTPGIPGGGYKLTIIRVYKDDFDIDNYDLSDFATLKWRSWAMDVTWFSK